MNIQYRILEATGLVNESNLNELGKEGWYLTNIIKNNNKFYYYFYKV